jgi:tetratricopeptide (TPR) repeat protein
MKLNTIWSGRLILAVLVIATSGSNVLAARSSNPRTGSFISPEKKTTEQRAIENYDEGLEHSDRAFQHRENALASDTENSRKKLLGRTDRELKKAVKKFNKVIKLQPEHYQAHANRGCALKELGDLTEAVDALEASLSLRAEYPPTMECRAEADLALGRFAEVRKAYVALVDLDPDKAKQLVEAIDAWLNNPPGDTPEAAITQMSAWVGQKRGLH